MAATLYLKLLGTPGFCFVTPTGKTPLLPLPTPLWAMLLAGLAACERQEASFETLTLWWNETCDENGTPARVYGISDPFAAPRIAKAALTVSLADARRELVRLHQKAVGADGETADKYTYLPKHQEQIIYLNGQSVQSDVAEFRALCQKITREPHTPPDEIVLLEQAQRLYEGDFLSGSDSYFGRAYFRRGGETPTRLIRPWIKREREKLRA